MKYKKILILISFLYINSISNAQVFELDNENNVLIDNTTSEDEVIVDKTTDDDLNNQVVSEQKIENSWMYIVQSRERNYNLIDNYLTNNHSVNEILFNGSPALHLSAWQNDLILFNTLLKHKPNLFILDNTKNNIFHWVANSNNNDILVSLLSYCKENKIDISKLINQKNIYGETPLHYASMTNNVAITQLLINNGALINDKSLIGSTSLMYATILGNWDVVDFLISKKADLTIKNNDNQSFDDYVLNSPLDMQLKLFNYLNEDSKKSISSRNTNTKSNPEVLNS